MDNTKTPPKTSITQRLRTDLGRSVGVTTVIQLLWLNRFTGTDESNSMDHMSVSDNESLSTIFPFQNM